MVHRALEQNDKQPTGLEKMVEKAKIMLRSGRITRIDRSTFQVIGDHGIYIVVRGVDGNYHCGCQGYMTRGFCSHALSVNLLEQRTKSRRRMPIQPRPEEPTEEAMAETEENEEAEVETEESEETGNTGEL